MNTVYAPKSETTAETFIWYRAHPRMSLGLAHLWKQNAVRYLASVKLSPETLVFPAVNASAGVQGIGTGNPGYSLTLEKNLGAWNVYGGLGLRSNENHGHFVGGVKWSVTSEWTLGVQEDGHQTNPFVTWSDGSLVGGLFLIESERPALMLGARF